MASAVAYLAMKGTSYSASTQVLVYVREVQPGSELVVSLGRADLTQVENEIEIIRSRGTLAKVVHSLNLADDPEFTPAVTLPRAIARWLAGWLAATSDEGQGGQNVAIEALARHIAIKRIGTSHSILVTVTTSDPEKSARIANEISQVMLQARGSAEPDGEKSPLLRERLRGLGPSVYVMTPALVPDKPSGPRKIFVIPGAVFAGFLVGATLALLLDLMDGTIRTAAQVERFGLECMGAIPLLARRKPAVRAPVRRDRERSGEDGFTPSPLLDQTLLRMTVATEAAKARIVGIASPIAGEGATTVARQFAHAAARSHRTVLLVETDRSGASGSGTREASFETPALFGAGREQRGGDLRPGDDGGPDVLAIAASDGGEGAASWWVERDQTSLASYDLIVVGLPPLEGGPAFRKAAQNVDGILLVMRWGGADVEQVERAFAVSGAVPSDFIGAVLNMVDGQMIGRFGDKLWEAEAFVAGRRRLFAAVMPPVEPVARPS